MIDEWPLNTVVKKSLYRHNTNDNTEFGTKMVFVEINNDTMVKE